MFHSRFGGLWVDRLNAADILNQKISTGEVPQEYSSYLEQIITDGFTVIRNAVDHRLIDDFLADIDDLDDIADFMVAKTGPDTYCHPSSSLIMDGTAKIYDSHVNFPSARNIIFNGRVSDFLRLYFEGGAIATQTLLFINGSEQDFHQDSAYVVYDRPMEFVATWIALEDIEEGSGELQYIPKSHRLPDFVFSGEFKHWSPKRDGKEQHINFLQRLKENASSDKLGTRKFLAKKGDMLIWHADLAHGGAKRVRNELTRKSLVTHYCSELSEPNFARFASNLYHPIKHSSGHYYCSRYYNTKVEPNEGYLLKPVFMGGQGKRVIVELTGTDLYDSTKARAQTLIQKHPRGVSISCECKDSGIFMNVEPLSSLIRNYEIKLYLHLLQNDVIQLFYLQPEQKSYSEKSSIRHRVEAGEISVNFSVGPLKNGADIRIDFEKPGNIIHLERFTISEVI